MSGRPFAAWRYVAVDELGDRPHVVVDGAARPGTVCTLSHWPRTPTPRRLWGDTSAEIVLRARRRPRLLPAGVELATVDHYDADGAIALGLLVLTGLAERHGPLLIEAAAVGDFDRVRSRRGALVAFALGALGAGHDTAVSARAALEMLPVLAEQPEAFEELWGPEAAAYDAACALRRRAAVGVEEHPALDLAVVRADGDALHGAGAGWNGAVLHPAAVHSATTCLRIATVVGASYELRYRYESWVRLARRPPRLRVDLSALAEALTRAESDGGRWRFDGAGAITPRLYRTDGAASTLEPGRWLAEVGAALEALDRHPPAWDPYAASAPVSTAS